MSLQNLRRIGRNRVTTIADTDIHQKARKCTERGCGRDSIKSLCGIHQARVRICVVDGCYRMFRDTHKQCTSCRANTNRECSCGRIFTSHKTKCRGCETSDYRELKHLMETDGPITRELRAEIRKSGPCVFCGGKAEHACRVWPISKGGPESPDNLVPACQDCSLSKNGSLLTEWLPERVKYGVEHSAIVAAEYARLMSVSV